MNDTHTFAKMFAKILIAALIIHNLQYGLACNGSVHYLRDSIGNFNARNFFIESHPTLKGILHRYWILSIRHGQTLLFEIKIYNRRNLLLCLIVISLQPEVNDP